MSDKKTYWVEIYFDAEDVLDPSQIGLIKHGLWKIIVWELDENNETIMESCDIRMHRLTIDKALKEGGKIRNKIQAKGFKCYLSHRNGNCKFPIKTAEYELIGYEVRPSYEPEEVFNIKN